MTALATVPQPHDEDGMSVSDTLTLAKLLFASRTLPDNIKSPEAAFAIILAGREMGLAPMVALRSIDFIRGRVTMRAELQVALVRRSPHCEYFRLVEDNEEAATWATKRRGSEEVRMRFTIADAKQAGLASSETWRKYTRNMLRARAASNLCKTEYQDCLNGVYDPDELAPATPQRIHVDLAPDLAEAAVSGDDIEALKEQALTLAALLQTDDRRDAARNAILANAHDARRLRSVIARCEREIQQTVNGSPVGDATTETTETETTT